LLIWDALTHPGEVERGEPPAPPPPSLNVSRAGSLFRLPPGTRELHGQPVSEKLSDQLSMLVKEQATRSPRRSLTWLSSRPEADLPASLRGATTKMVAIEPWSGATTDGCVAPQARSSK